MTTHKYWQPACTKCKFPLWPHVLDQKFALLFIICSRPWCVVRWLIPVHLGPHTSNKLDWVYDMIVAHVGGNEGLAVQVSDPVMELVMMRYDRLPLLKYIAWNIKNPTLYQLQCWGRSGGLIPYHSNTAYLHWCVTRSVPFTMDGANERHAHVLCLWRRQWASVWESLPSVAMRASLAS